MPSLGRQIRFLASVSSAQEAGLAVGAGADIVDGKDPISGALGALPVATVRAIRSAVARPIPVSATVGDLPADGDLWSGRVREMAATGVDYVKIGVFPGGDARAAIERVGRLDLGVTRLVGVLLADLRPELGLIATMARAGFAGVLLDTAQKSGPPLPGLLGAADIAEFIGAVRRAGMLAGLAGSLQPAHIPPLAALGPDIMGFRGALCADGDRGATLDPMRARRVRDQLRSVRSESPAAAGPGLETSIA